MLKAYFGLLSIIKAAITPGIQPQRVSRNTITMEPHPFPITAKGGNIMANNTLKQLIFNFDFDRCTYMTKKRPLLH